MNIAIIGGKLQGVEALYLSAKAGYRTLLVDKRQAPPGRGLCDAFVSFDFTTWPEKTPELPDDFTPDVILPALEDKAVLRAIAQWAERINVPLAFDLDAFDLSHSKFKSDALFQKLGLPAPRPWPQCGFPAVAKPDSASGSQGVEILYTQADADRIIQPDATDLVVQEFLEGPSYSIEVVGNPGNYRALQVTDLGMDAEHDCCRVTAPVDITPEQTRAFEAMALELAEAIQLTGIMDLEVINHDGELKLLEIDARLPSQTPMTVLASTGINMVALLAHTFVVTAPPVPAPTARPAHAMVEHIQVNPLEIEVLGEHIMATDGPLTHITDFFGADETLTSYAPDKTEWVATLIFTAPDPDTLARKRRECYNRLRALNN